MTIYQWQPHNPLLLHHPNPKKLGLQICKNKRRNLPKWFLNYNSSLKHLSKILLCQIFAHDRISLLHRKISSLVVQIFYKCLAPGHIGRFCNYNRQDQIDTNVKCQLCNQFGHSVVQCYQFSSGNRRTPGYTCLCSKCTITIRVIRM